MTLPQADYRALIEQIPAVPYTDLPNDEQTPVYVGPQIEHVLGIDRTEYLSDPTCWNRHIHPDDRGTATFEYAEAIREGRAFDFDYRMVKPDGTVVWIRDQGSVLHDAEGRPTIVQGILYDITEAKLAEGRQRRQNTYLSVLHETALAAIRRLDESDLLRTIVHRAASLAGTADGYAYLRAGEDQLEVKAGTGLYEEWLGYRLAVGDGMAGRAVARGCPVVVEDYDGWEGRSDTFPRGLLGPGVAVPLQAGGRQIGAIGLSHPPGGSSFTQEDVDLLARFAHIASLSLENVRLHAAAQEELRQREQAEESLQFLAFHDPLTGLPNRAMFEEMLDVAVARARRGGLAVAVVYMDLDNFKLVNDSLGHAAGDELLRQTAARLRSLVRDVDVVARQGGDEFLILLADLEPEEAPGRSGSPTGTITTVLNRLEDSLRRPFSLSGAEVYTSASIGISIHPDHAEAGPTLLRYADAAMYASKRTGPGHHLLFAPSLADSASRLSFATRLRKAVDLSEWELQYQPIVDLTSGMLVGVEALLRWRQADGSLIMPAHFIPVLEEMGLIGALGDWLVGEVCRQTKVWQDQRLPLFTTFNLSLGELWQADLGAKMLDRVEASGADPSRLVVEITESIAMTDPVRTERILAELKEAGLRLAIDDFGTGHSSLSRLTHLPADILKIDRPFLVGVPSVPSARSIVKAIVEVAMGLDMLPVAEGVETEDQRDFLLEAGCTVGQGFLFSPAVPPADIAGLMRRGPRAIRRLVRAARRPA